MADVIIFETFAEANEAHRQAELARVRAEVRRAAIVELALTANECEANSQHLDADDLLVGALQYLRDRRLQAKADRILGPRGHGPEAA